MLPKIQQDSKAKKEYLDSMNYKIEQKLKTIKKNKPNGLERFNWGRCEIKMADNVDNNELLMAMTQFQKVCNQKKIACFYSYFFLKALRIDTISSDEDSSSIVQEKIKHLKEETDLLKKQRSFFDKIINFIEMREDLLKEIESHYKKESYNLIYEKVNNIRFLNLEIVDLVSKWKERLSCLILQDSNNRKEQKQVSQRSTTNFLPIFFYNDLENYISKMVNDNANLINALNSKNVKFISPPNPFFLTQDNNKMSMSSLQQEQIEKAMDLMAKEKAFELKMLLEPPEYMPRPYTRKQLQSKVEDKKSPEHKKRAFSTQKSQQLKRVYSTLNGKQFQNRHKNQQKPLTSFFQGSLQKKRVYSTSRLKSNQNWRQKSLALKLNVLQIQKIKNQTETKKKQFQLLTQRNKDKQLSVLDKSRKKSRYTSLHNTREAFPRQKEKILADEQQSPLREKLRLEVKSPTKNQSPYKSKISNLRKNVQKTVANKVKESGVSNRPKKESLGDLLPIKQEQNVAQSLNYSGMSQRQKNTPTRLTEIKTPKPKMKLVAERQVNVENTVNPLLELFGYKVGQSSSLLSQKQENRKGFNSTFYKSSTEKKKNRSNQKKQKSFQGKLSGKTVGIFSGGQRFNKTQNMTNKVQQSQTLQSKDKKLRSKRNKSVLEQMSENQNQSPQKGLFKSTLIEERASFELGDEKIEKHQAKVIKKDQKVEEKLNSLKSRLRDLEIYKTYTGKKGLKKKEETKGQTNNNNKRKAEKQLFEKKEENLQKTLNTSSYKSNKNPHLKMEKEAQLLERKIQYLLEKQEELSKPEMNGFTQQNFQQKQSEYPLGLITCEEGKDIQDAEFQDLLSENKLRVDENLQNLNKKEQLIRQANQLKIQEIEASRKDKGKFSEELRKKEAQLEALEHSIKQLKEKRRSVRTKPNVSLNEDSKNRLQSENIKFQEQQKVLKLKQEQLLLQNIQIQAEMKRQEEKFIRLKEQEYKIKEQAARKKYAEDLKSLRKEYLQKQKVFETKILEEERKRKEHEIQLLKQKREAQQLKMKLQEQAMKEQLLREILQREKQKQNNFQLQSQQFQKQVREKLQREIKQKQEYQTKILGEFEKEKSRLQLVMKGIRQKNQKIQQENKRKMQQMEQIQRQKEAEELKFLQLQKQVQRLQAEHKRVLDAKDTINQAGQEKQNRVAKQEKHKIDDLQQIKRNVKKEILNQILKRKKQEEEEELIFERERRERIQKLEDEIKEMFRQEQKQIEAFQKDSPKNNLKIEKHELRFDEQALSPKPQIQIKRYPQTPVHQIEEKKVVQKRINSEKKQFPSQQNETLCFFLNLIEKRVLRGSFKNWKRLLDDKEQSRVRAQEKGFSQNYNNDSLKVVGGNTTNFSQEMVLTQKEFLHADDQTIQDDRGLQINSSNQNQQTQLQPGKALQQQLVTEKKESRKSEQKPSPTTSVLEKQAQNSRLQDQDPKNIQQENLTYTQKQKSVVKQSDVHVEKSEKGSQDKRENFSDRLVQIAKPTSKQTQNMTSKKKQVSSLKTDQNKHNFSPGEQEHYQLHQLKQSKKTQTNKQDNTLERANLSPKKEQKEATKQTVSQSNQEISQKYQTLLKELDKIQKPHFLRITEEEISHFTSSFYSKFPMEVREMLPYTQEELSQILKSQIKQQIKETNCQRVKRVDIFSSQHVGWFDFSTRKYTLIGMSLEPVPLIEKKYGEAQVEMVYLFNKQNPYQKQFLVKQIKMIEKVGYVYQKKIAEKKSLYSIKFIVKIPSLPQKQPPCFDQSLQIYSILILNNEKPRNQQKQDIDDEKLLKQRKKHAYNPLLAKVMRQSLTRDELEKFYNQASNYSIDMNLLCKQIQTKKSQFLTDPALKINMPSDNAIQCQIKINIPYFTLGRQIYFTLSATQYQIQTSLQASPELLYLADLPSPVSNTLKIMVMETSVEQINDGVFYLSTLIHQKLSHTKEFKKGQKRVQLYFPALNNQQQSISFQKNKDLPISVPFTYKSHIISKTIECSLARSLKSLTAENEKIIALEDGSNKGFLFTVLRNVQQQDNKTQFQVLFGQFITRKPTNNNSVKK